MTWKSSAWKTKNEMGVGRTGLEFMKVAHYRVQWLVGWLVGFKSSGNSPSVNVLKLYIVQIAFLCLYAWLIIYVYEGNRFYHFTWIRSCLNTAIWLQATVLFHMHPVFPAAVFSFYVPRAFIFCTNEKQPCDFRTKGFTFAGVRTVMTPDTTFVAYVLPLWPLLFFFYTFYMSLRICVLSEWTGNLAFDHC
jgi:hypothetical protein